MEAYRRILNVTNVPVLDRQGHTLLSAQPSPADFLRMRYNQLRDAEGEASVLRHVLSGRRRTCRALQQKKAGKQGMKGPCFWFLDEKMDKIYKKKV